MSETPPDATAVVLDAKGLRALAHPVRVELVRLLRKYGPSTATRLAQRLGVNSGTASYHLRRLGAAGFVEEDTERGNARERWWRPVHQVTRFTSNELARSEPDATMAYMRAVAASHALLTQQALNEQETMPVSWFDLLDLSHYALRLTPEEAGRLRDELVAVARRYRRDVPGAPAPEGAGALSLVLHVLPQAEES